jgi:hypothetical protein
MRKLFSTPNAPRSPLSPRRANGDLNAQLRASLDGLEVHDSTWDEWLACQQAQAKPSQPRASVKPQ